MKKNIIIILVAIFALSAAIASETLVEGFTATSDGTNITLKWRSIDESNVKMYEIYRGLENEGFSPLEQLETNGSYTQYEYIDRGAFLKTASLKKDDRILSKRTYTYKLKIIYDDNTSKMTNEIKVDHQVNSIRRTWGMIKEMFR